MKRLNWAAIVVVLVAIIGLALFGIYVWRSTTGPFDSARLQPGENVWTPDGVIVTTLEDRPGGLRTGDVVIAIDGRGVESWVGALPCPSVACDAPLHPRWALGQEVRYTVLREGRELDLSVRLGRYPVGLVLLRGWGGFTFAFFNLAIMAFVFIKRPSEPAVQVLFLSAASMLSSMTWGFGLQIRDIVEATGFWLHRATTEGIYLLVWIALLHFTLIFPRPHPIIARRRWIIPMLYVIPPVAYVGYILAIRPVSHNTLDWLGRMPQGQSAILTVYLLVGLLAVITNYRAQRDPQSRQQIRVIVFALIPILTLAITLWLLPQIVLGQLILTSDTMGVIGLLLPLSLAFSVLRFRLWDIDVIVNRTLLYLLLTSLVVALYVLVVGLLGALFQSRGTLSISLFATGLVAVLFQPMRDRLQRTVNRLMYGERDEPYAVLSRLSRRLESTLAPDAVLPTIVETVAQALKLPYVAIALREGQDYRIAAATGHPGEDPIVLPLTYQTETVGQLICGQREPGGPFTTPEQRLLEDMAHQAGVAVHAVQLTAALQRSRERLVTTREEERRRLRRDLHDGLGPALAAMTLKLDAAKNLLANRPGDAEPLLVDLKTQMQSALGDIRRLVYNLRPPALDELGLIPALTEQAAQYNRENGLTTSIDAPSALPPLPAAVEVAAYRITLEALTNALRHAQARVCHVQFSMPSSDVLQVAITDDGVGMPPDVEAGVGLTSMRERAEELGGTLEMQIPSGGGTQVIARLPLSSIEV